MDFPVPRNSSDLLRRGGRRSNISESIKEDCFCPLTIALRYPALQKRD